jgi:putative tricarboxylic transport membrane protein
LQPVKFTRYDQPAGVSAGDFFTMKKFIKKPDAVSATLFLLIGLCIIGFSSIIEVGSFENPAPGLFPLLSGIGLVVLSLILLIQSVKIPETDIFNLCKEGYFRVFGLPIAMIVYAIVVDFLGFIIATTLLLFYFMKLVSKYSLQRSFAYALLISVTSYVIFNILLEVGLPSGLIGI